MLGTCHAVFYRWFGAVGVASRRTVICLFLVRVNCFPSSVKTQPPDPFMTKQPSQQPVRHDGDVSDSVATRFLHWRRSGHRLSLAVLPSSLISKLTSSCEKQCWCIHIASGFPVYRYARGSEFGKELVTRTIWEEGKSQGDVALFGRQARALNAFDSSEDEEIGSGGRSQKPRLPPPLSHPSGMFGRGGESRTAPRRDEERGYAEEEDEDDRRPFKNAAMMERIRGNGNGRAEPPNDVDYSSNSSDDDDDDARLVPLNSRPGRGTKRIENPNKSGLHRDATRRGQGREDLTSRS